MTEPRAHGHGDPVVQQLVAACLDEADRFTRDVFDRACEEYPEDARAIARRYEGLRRSGLIASGPIDGAGPDPWEAGARAALTDPDAARQFDAIGPYQPLRELGRGGQAVVYLAEDLRLHRPVALKILKGLGPLSETVMNRFRREAEVASSLDHPGICAVFDAGVRDGVPYIAMRFVAGETLGEHIEAAKEAPAPESDRSISVGSRTKGEIHRLLEIIERAARALHVAHEAGIVHRDVKPGNIMVTPQGEPVLLDFGLAGDEDDAMMTLTETGDILGTPAYMSPEQLMAKRIRVDRRTDVYSLGVTLFECLTLERPYRAATREAMYQAIQYKHPTDIRSLNATLPPDVQVIVETALEKDRDKRYRTAEDFADDLRRVRLNEPIAARPVSALGRAWRWAKRRPFRAALIAAMIVGIPALTALVGHVIANRPAVLAAERQARIDEIDRHLEAGYSELAHGDPKIALASFDAALEMEPASGEAIGGRALALYRSRDYAGCLKYLDESGTIEGGEWALHRVRIDALHKLGRAGAADDLEKRETAEPKTALGFFLAGSQLMRGCRHQADRETFRTAVRYFSRAALTAAHARPLYHFQLAHAAGHLAEDAPTRQAAAALMTLWPFSHRANHWAGYALSAVDPTASVAAYRKAIALRPDDAGMHLNLGAVLCDRLGDHEAAIAAFRRAIELQSNHAEAYANLSNALRQDGQYEQAIAAARRASKLAPELGRVHGVLGLALANEGLLDEAIAAYERAIELKPDGVEALVNLGHALVRKGRTDDAIVRYRKALKLQPNFGAAHANLGAALALKGQYREAIAWLHKAVRLVDGSRLANVYDTLGATLCRSGDSNTAVGWLRKAVLLSPDGVSAHFNLGVALRKTGRLEDAMDSLETALRLQPDHADAHGHLGGALAQLGRRADGILHRRRAVELKPHDAGVHVSLGVALAENGQPAEAIISYEKAIDLDANIAKAHYNLGNAHRDMGQHEEATDAYEAAIDLDPDYARAHCNLGFCHVACGEPVLALRSLRRGHELGSAQLGWRYPSAKWVRDGESRLLKRVARVASEGFGDADPATRSAAADGIEAVLDGWRQDVDRGARDSTIRSALRTLARAEPWVTLRDDTAADALPAAERARWRKIWETLDSLVERVRRKR